MDFDFVNYSRRSLLLFVMVANIIGCGNRRRPVCGLSGDRVGDSMNIETVNELIQSLESAGELSIREQKFLKLAKAFQQLAAENVALKAAFNKPDAWLSCHSIRRHIKSQIAVVVSCSASAAGRKTMTAVIRGLFTPSLKSKPPPPTRC
jgi:hypothetical protein